MPALTLLALFAALAEANLTPLLPPIEVREVLHNITVNANASVGHSQSMRNYDTAAYKVYIAIMVFGTVAAALMIPIIYSPDFLQWYRQKKHKKAVAQRKIEVAEATSRMRQRTREMAEPQQAHVRPERPGSNWI